MEINRCNYYIMYFMVILASFFFMTSNASAENSTTAYQYYVSKDGNDENTGSIDDPWLTIQKAANSTKSGDIVFVREGTYSEFVNITNSGSKEEGFITFKAYPGEKPILDAKDQTIKSGNIAFFALKKASYIVIDGFEMRNLITNREDYYPNGVLVTEESNNIKLLNNNIHHIENHSIKGNAHGVLIYGNSTNSIHDITIQNNQIHHLTLGYSEALTLSGNVEGFTVSNNKIYNNNNIGIDVAGFYKACQSNCVDQVRNGKISNNLVYKNSSKNNQVYNGYLAAGGIYADGSTNIVINNNLVYKNDFGIELASENLGETTSYITVEKNNIFNNNGAGLIIGGASKSNGGAYKNIIRNNEFSLNDRLNQGYGEVTLQNQVNMNQFLNNIFYINKTTELFHFSDKKEKSNTIKDNKEYFKILFSPQYELMMFTDLT